LQTESSKFTLGLILESFAFIEFMQHKAANSSTSLKPNSAALAHFAAVRAYINRYAASYCTYNVILNLSALFLHALTPLTIPNERGKGAPIITLKF
jgi:hypothetical protein